MEIRAPLLNLSFQALWVCICVSLHCTYGVIGGLLAAVLPRLASHVTVVRSAWRCGIERRCRNTASEDQTYPCTKLHLSMYFSNLRHSLHANLCVGGEYNYIRLVVNKDLQAAVCSSIPPESLYKDG